MYSNFWVFMLGTGISCTQVLILEGQRDSDP